MSELHETIARLDNQFNEFYKRRHNCAKCFMNKKMCKTHSEQATKLIKDEADLMIFRNSKVDI